ncbi:MAG TPA: hypothetical protein VMU98_09275 [Acidimicrobiales bacterium]|nr:hypothetical protein [Acidimicrobiales bacterium]
MNRVAVATCAGENVDPDSPLLLDALAAQGLDSELCVWDDARVRWGDYDLVVIRSTWDYAARRQEFLDWARNVERLVNPFAVVEYSSDKHYLADLAAKDVLVVDSQFCDVGSTPRFPEGDFVVKPCVGAGSMGAERYRAIEHSRAIEHVERLHAGGFDALIQPYVDSVDQWGERALIFIDGRFSHAMTKGAMLNVTQLDRNTLYRREQMSRSDAETDALAAAGRALDAGGFSDLLYARVDLVQTINGWALMELELVEPSLFLSYDEAAPRRLASAIRARLTPSA